ncbi:DMT family transporter [Pseudalkalibacillus caeni]|uniref:DMT family transporter n=1 Tax=Exobacillus caeni TaxID=2574798 RepID=UPI00319E6395
MVAQSLSFIFIKKATRTIDPRFMTGGMLLAGSVTLFIVSIFVEPRGRAQLLESPAWIWLVFIGSAVLATGLGHMFYNKAIQQIGAGETAIFNNMTPFFALIGSALFLNEAITGAQVAGFMLIVCGVILGTGVIDRTIVQRRYNEKNTEA